MRKQLLHVVTLVFGSFGLDQNKSVHGCIRCIRPLKADSRHCRFAWIRLDQSHCRRSMTQPDTRILLLARSGAQHLSFSWGAGRGGGADEKPMFSF